MLNILLPTDFSENAQKAIYYAVYLLEREVCKFYFLHAYHDTPSISGNKADSRNDLEKLMERVRIENDNPKHYYEIILETDSLLNLINKTVLNIKMDYIFVGTKGFSTLHEVFMGSNTVDLIKNVHTCPIITVPQTYDYDLPEEIIFASDYEHYYIEPELAPLINMVKLWDSRLSVVHLHAKKQLTSEQERRKELLKHILKEVKTKFKEEIIIKSIAYTLQQLTHENENIGMIALLNTKHSFFQKLLREPVIKNLTFQTNVPLLVLPQLAENI
ncbi:universal stress protein [Maribacter sp. CXY002]|uniref:universal stress protein n=1 Tax=Maribacter luteocoastalis TaxID=3407671 RepID=UPI003B674BE5